MFGYNHQLCPITAGINQVPPIGLNRVEDSGFFFPSQILQVRNSEHDVFLMRVFTLFFPKCDCLCCLERVYSLAEVEQYVPPVHQSAVIELVNSLWSLNNQDNENSGVRTAHWHYCLTLYAF